MSKKPEKKSKAKKPANPLWDERPLMTPWGNDADGNPLRCCCGCGRIADGIDWDTREPSSWNCWIEAFIKRCEERDAERERDKAERVRRMADGRALARGEELTKKRATA